LLDVSTCYFVNLKILQQRKCLRFIMFTVISILHKSLNLPTKMMSKNLDKTVHPTLVDLLAQQTFQRRMAYSLNFTEAL